MAKLQLDSINSNRANNMLALILMISCSAVAHALWLRNNLLDTRQLIQEQLGSYEKSSIPHTNFHHVPEKIDAKAIVEIDEITNVLQTPWETILDSVQVAISPEASIKKLQSGAKAKLIVLSGQAENSESTLVFLQQLQQQKVWRSVSLKNETRNAGAINASKPYDFEIALEWQQN